MKNIYKKLLISMMVALFITLIVPQSALASGSLSLNQKDKKLVVGDTYQLKISGTTKKVRWSTSNAKVVKVSKNGLITAKKKGTAVVKAKVSGKTYRCNVTVVLQQSAEANRAIKQINIIRRQYGRVSLKQNEYLTKAANKRAKEIAVKFSASKRPNGTFWTSAISMKYNYKADPTENIARECATVDSLMATWMGRDDTKSALLNANYRDIGVGYYVDEFGKSFWVAIFANR